MAPPYRDIFPRIEWDEIAYARADLLGDGGLLEPGYLADWTIEADYDTGLYGGPHLWWDGTYPWLAGFVLFSWLDAGPGTRSSWIRRTKSGLTPGLLVGFTAIVDWSLDTPPGLPLNLFFEIEGETTERFSAFDTGATYLTIDGRPNISTKYLQTVVPGSGDIILRLGGENIYPSCNVFAAFSDAELVDMTCEPTPTSYRLDFPYPIEEVRSYRTALPGSDRLVLANGVEDAWLVGHMGVLKGETRWIPAVSELALPLNDGWEDRDDAGTVRAGWDRFRRHANRGGRFTFFPDRDDDDVSYPCKILEPIPKPSLEDDAVRSVPLAFRTLNGALIEGY